VQEPDLPSSQEKPLEMHIAPWRAALNEMYNGAPSMLATLAGQPPPSEVGSCLRPTL
jgi:hypothetical protein